MKSLLRSLIVIAVILSLLLVPISVRAQGPGSKDVLKEAPIIRVDSKRNISFRVYESLNNEVYQINNQFSRMRFYVAPFFQLASQNGKIYTRVVSGGDTVRYVFKVECYSADIYRQAVDVINQTYSSIVGDYHFAASQIQNMDHGPVYVQLSLPPGLASKMRTKFLWRGGDLDFAGQLLPVETLTIDVPMAADNDFRHLIDGGGLSVEFITYFNVLNLSQIQIAWSLSDVVKTHTYKNLVSGGEQFVSAKQLADIMREAADEKEIYILQDPDIDQKLVQKANEIFKDLLALDSDLEVATRQNALEIDAKLREGTGLTAEQFSPIVLVWDVRKELADVTTYSEANKVMRSTFVENQRMSQDAFSFYAETEGGVDFLVWDAGGGGHISSYENVEEFNKAVTQGFFESQDEYESFRSRNQIETGQEVHFVARGLDLVEMSNLEQRFDSTGRILVVQSLGNGTSFVTSLAPASSVTWPIIMGSRIGAGETETGNTNWQVYQTNGIFVDVDTSAAGFTKTPHYVTSLAGAGGHWFTTGGSSIYTATPTSFRVYVRSSDDSPITPDSANNAEWHITWIGIEP